MSRRAPVQARSRARRQSLLDATASVLAAEGTARLTTTRVAEAAGCSVGALYAYFDDKDALVAALVERYGARLQEAVAGALAGPHAGWEEAACAALDAFAGFYRREPGYAALWIGAAWSPELVVAGRRWGEALGSPLGAALRGFAPGLDEARAQRIALVALTLVSSLVTLALERSEPEIEGEARQALVAYLGSALAGVGAG